MDAVRAMAAQHNIADEEDILVAAQLRFTRSAIAQAARHFATAIETSEPWWVGFAERCLSLAPAEVQARGKSLAEAAMTLIQESEP